MDLGQWDPKIKPYVLTVACTIMSAPVQGKKMINLVEMLKHD